MGDRSGPRLGRVVGGAIGAGLALAALLAGLFAALLAGVAEQADAGCEPAYGPSRNAVADIPAPFLRLYVAAGREYGLGWEYLAGIGSIESDHGRLQAPGVRAGENFAGAGGPMQFLAGTWAQFGVDGDGDGHRDRHNPADAVPGAANYLRASGAPGDWARALFAYNHASWYVADVQQRAADYRGAADLEPGALASADEESSAADGRCGELVVAAQGDGREVLRHPRIDVYPGGRADLAAGRVDPRVTGLLLALAAEHTLTLTSLQTGHSTVTASGNRSNHADGRAVDIGAVDGVSCTNVARSSPCGRIARTIAALTGTQAPSEVIFCFDPGPGPNSWAAGDHCDHVHAGYPAR
jgi:hypothetical protein